MSEEEECDLMLIIHFWQKYLAFHFYRYLIENKLILPCLIIILELTKYKEVFYVVSSKLI